MEAPRSRKVTGHAAPQAAPDWLERMTPGCWYQISGDRPDLGLSPTPAGTRYLIDTDPASDPRINPARGVKERLRRWLGRPPHSPWEGRGGFPTITEGWNGAVFASGMGACGAMIVFGGGHNDYFGSDVHAFDLATRQWMRVSDGYVSGAANEYGAGAVYPDSVYPDGSPLPPHTYGYVQYDPVGNDYLLLKGQLELGPDVKATPISHMFNLDSLTWRRGPRHPSAVLGSGGWSAWDASRRIIWGHSGDSGNGFIGFSPDGDNGDGTFGSWTALYPKKMQSADHNAMAMDPEGDIIVVVAGAANTLYALDPSAPEGDFVQLSSTGEPPVLAECAALEYAPNLHRLVYYSAKNGPQLYSITAPDGGSWAEQTRRAWTWRSVLNSDNRLDPIAHASKRTKYGINKHHTFGRFRVASYRKADLAVLIRHVDSPVYAMKLA
jgi:hypothetical protein